MGRKRCTTPFLSDSGIQEEFDTLFFALGAPERMALFCRRRDNFKNNIFLLPTRPSILMGCRESAGTGAASSGTGRRSDLCQQAARHRAGRPFSLPTAVLALARHVDLARHCRRRPDHVRAACLAP